MNLQPALTYYKERLNAFQHQLKTLTKKLNTLSVLRILVFLATITGVYFLNHNWLITAVILVIGTAFFLWLLSRYTDFKHKKQFVKLLFQINQDEIEIANGTYKNRADGLQYLNPEHPYSLDIDLFGKGSFFQYINRTATQEGETLLANLLLENSIENIPNKQTAINELAQQHSWRQEYTATAKMIDTEHNSAEILKWLQTYRGQFSKTHLNLSALFSAASLVVIAMVAAQGLSLMFLGYWLLFGLAISALYLKKVNQLSAQSSKAKDVLKSYASLLDKIETANFKSAILTEKQQQITDNGTKASTVLLQFSKSIDRLDNRNNIIWAFLANGFFLVDLRQSYHIEKWISKHSHLAQTWFSTISFFDAYNTLGTYTFNHPESVFPNIKSNNVAISAVALAHPLIERDKRIPSDVNINNQEFFIVTGANMAGKSTFLRTIGLHIVLANVGLPVCATKSTYNPVKLITSMRTTDSLTDESSYFFSELTRLKFVVDTLATTPHFVILDEILKGTNSTDKAIGSRKFVEKLITLNATGIIATHDLSLCEIEANQTAVKNYYFDAEIKNDELFFDYKLKLGICQNMNASFLLKKMRIVE